MSMNAAPPAHHQGAVAFLGHTVISRGVPHTAVGLGAAGRPHPPWGAHFHWQLQLKICKTSTLLLLIECQKIKGLLCIPSARWHGHHLPHHNTSSATSCTHKMNSRQQDAGVLRSLALVQHPTHFGGTEAPHIFCKQLAGRKQAELCSRPGPCMGS